MPILPKKKIVFSEEAHFGLGGYVNKQNCCIWGTEIPHAYIEKPMLPKRVTVWCGCWSRGIIGPFFFIKISKKWPLQSMAIVIGSFWPSFSSQKLKKKILATFDFNRTALREKREKPKTVLTPGNIAAVAESLIEALSTSIHRRSQQLNISKASLWELHKNLGIPPYKFQLVQELKPIDHPMSFRFAK